MFVFASNIWDKKPSHLTSLGFMAFIRFFLTRCILKQFFFVSSLLFLAADYKRLIVECSTSCCPSWISFTFTVLWPDSSFFLPGAAYAQKPGPKWGSNHSGVWGEATCLGATDGRAETELRLSPAAGDLTAYVDPTKILWRIRGTVVKWLALSPVYEPASWLGPSCVCVLLMF